MQRKEVVIIAVITFIVVVAWIATSVLGTKSSAPVNPKINEVIEPIDPTFDQTTIDRIKNLGAAPTPTPRTATRSAAVTPQPRSTPSPTASASALPLPPSTQATRPAQPIQLPGDNAP